MSTKDTRAAALIVELQAALNDEQVSAKGDGDTVAGGLTFGMLRELNVALNETRKAGVIVRLRGQITALDAELAKQKEIAHEAQLQFHHAEKGRVEAEAELLRYRELTPVKDMQLGVLRGLVAKAREQGFTG